MDLKKYVKSPGDFIVREAIDGKFLRKFRRAGKGVEKMSGPYTLILVKKMGMTTEDAVKIIAEKFGIGKRLVGYAGLKDKFAITEQYMTVKKDIISFREENMEISVIGKTDRHISVGDLICNEFEITLHNVRNTKKIIGNIKKIEKSWLRNFFGPQRFSKNNHIIGGLLAKKEFEKAEKLLFRKIESVPKERLKFYLHAYQSCLFNRKLKKTKKAFIELKPIKIDELRISCAGGKRKAKIKTGKIACEISGNVMKLKFALPKGSYATALLEQIGL